MGKTSWNGKAALVTGGSAGFGRVLSQRLAELGAKVAIAGRNQRRLDEALTELSTGGRQVVAFQADVTRPDQVDRLVGQTVDQFGELDLLVNSAGQSSRGSVLETTPDAFREALDLNFFGVLHCSQAAAPNLIRSQGHLVNIGSLASKSVSRFLGTYPVSKHAVAAITGQLRLELAPHGVHVLLVCPGPIARADAGRRYEQQAQELPEAARQPGGGVKLKGIPPEHLATRLLRACERRQPELVVPARARLLFALSQLSPTLGQWVIHKMTSGG